MATRCFSPPLSFRPRSPTIVLYPSLIRAMAVSNLAFLAAASTSSRVAPTLCGNCIVEAHSDSETLRSLPDTTDVYSEPFQCKTQHIQQLLHTCHKQYSCRWCR